MGTDAIDADAQALSNALHRALAEGSGRCWLLVDTVPRPLTEAHPFDATLLARAPRQVPSPASDVDVRQMPLLCELDSAQFADSDIIRMAIDEALAERQPDLLAQGIGRRIAGWLETSAESAALARHVADRFIVRQPDGIARKLRWFDPAALWAMWPLLEPAQRKTLLGPVDTFWLLDPAGRWLPLRADFAGKAPARLALSIEQFAEIGRIGALNGALREWGAASALPDALVTARVVAAAALGRAAGLGFADRDDLVAFALRALTVHPRFDRHPLVRDRLAKREADDYFTALVDDLRPEDWQRIRAETDTASPPEGGRRP